MLHKAKDALGFTVEAVDGYIGTVTDIYFDDQQWAVRYLVVDVSGTILDQHVLISPVSVGEPDWEKRTIPVSLTRKKISASPQEQTDLPVSRQYEIALRRYYEWPIYWGQVEFLDTRDIKEEETQIPSEEDATETEDTEPEISEEEAQEESDSMLTMPGERDEDEISELEFSKAENENIYSPQLRSLRDVLGYRIESSSGEDGVVDDFILEDSDWVIRYLAINTRTDRHGKMVLLTLHWVRDVNWGLSRIHVTISEEDLENTPPYNPTVPVTRDYERLLYDYYDRLKY